MKVAFPDASTKEAVDIVAQLQLAETLAAQWKPEPPPASQEKTAPTTSDLAGVSCDVPSAEAPSVPDPVEAEAPPRRPRVGKRARQSKLVTIDEMALQTMQDMARARGDWMRSVEVSLLKGAVWWSQLREPMRNTRLSRMLDSSWWESLVAVMIGLNSLFMGYMTDYTLQTVRGGETSDVMQIIEGMFVAFFSVELCLRLAVHRQYYFCNEDATWNCFDLLIVLLSIWDVAAAGVQATREGNVSFMRSVRLLRLARTLRVLRLFKFASSLRRMLQSLLGSFVELCWSLSLLCFVFYIFAIATVQGVSNYMSGAGPDAELVEELTLHFGSVLRAMMTYYMATSGGNDWSTYYDPLVKASEITAGLFVFVVAFTQIALLNILTGVFVENAMKLAQPDRAMMMLEQRKADMQSAEDLREILAGLDLDSTGTVSWNEFKIIAEDPNIFAALEVMGLDVHDVGLLFDMLSQASKSREVEFHFLVDACMKMKGPASSIDLQALMYKTDRLADTVQALSSGLAPR